MRFVLIALVGIGLVVAMIADSELGGTAAHGEPTSTPGGPTPTLDLTSEWQSLAPMPTPRSEMPGVVLDGTIYVGGGFTDDLRVSTVLEAYDPLTDTWETRAPLPLPRHHHMAAAYDGRLYMFGGYAHLDFREVFNTTLIYDPTTDTWSFGADMPVNRAAGAAVVLDGFIYLVGGVGEPSPRLLRYDPLADTWEQLAHMREVRDHVAAVALDGKIYALGGRNSRIRDFNSIEVYNPATDTWEVGPPMNDPRAGYQAAVVGGQIVVAGGELLAASPRVALATVELFDPLTQTWVYGPPMPIGLHGNPVVAVGGTVYVLGGAYLPAAIANTGEVLVYQFH